MTIQGHNSNQSWRAQDKAGRSRNAKPTGALLVLAQRKESDPDERPKVACGVLGAHLGPRDDAARAASLFEMSATSARRRTHGQATGGASGRHIDAG